MKNESFLIQQSKLKALKAFRRHLKTQTLEASAHSIVLICSFLAAKKGKHNELLAVVQPRSQHLLNSSFFLTNIVSCKHL